MMASQTRNGSIFTNDQSAGIHNWFDVGYAQFSDNFYAEVQILTAGESSTLLVVTGFNFNIPAGAIILGVECRIEKKSATGGVNDLLLSLVKNGVGVGQNKASVQSWPSMDSFFVYGSPTDKWGTTHTPQDINSPSFGVRLQVESSIDNGQADVDYIELTVYYQRKENKNSLRPRIFAPGLAR